MNIKRRKVLRAAAAVCTVAALPLVRHAAAADWNKAAFGAGNVAETLKQIGATNAAASKDIVVKLPDVAENGAAVPIEITSRLPDTQSISIVADKNPFPLVATFTFTPATEPYASTRIKLAESSDVRVIVVAGGRTYAVVREVRVVTGGCG